VRIFFPRFRTAVFAHAPFGAKTLRNQLPESLSWLTDCAVGNLLCNTYWRETLIGNLHSSDIFQNKHKQKFFLYDWLCKKGKSEKKNNNNNKKINCFQGFSRKSNSAAELSTFERLHVYIFCCLKEKRHQFE